MKKVCRPDSTPFVNLFHKLIKLVKMLQAPFGGGRDSCGGRWLKEAIGLINRPEISRDH